MKRKYSAVNFNMQTLKGQSTNQLRKEEKEENLKLN